MVDMEGGRMEVGEVGGVFKEGFPETCETKRDEESGWDQRGGG